MANNGAIPLKDKFKRVILKCATTHNHPEPSTITQNHPQPPQKPPTTSQKLCKKAKTYHKQLCYRTDVNIETDVDFDSHMKQWYT